ncbi:MAG TPA: hypothetical protein VMI73_26180 [Trebonia sp.]|nr:hypothetical protein [Trebonia sp.]
MQGRDLGLPGFDLDEPGTIEFTAERALRGQALNRFALSLRSPGNRAPGCRTCPAAPMAPGRSPSPRSR